MLVQSPLCCWSKSLESFNRWLFSLSPSLLTLAPCCSAGRAHTATLAVSCTDLLNISTVKSESELENCDPGGNCLRFDYKDTQRQKSIHLFGK